MTSPDTDTAVSRPRVEGDREQEILDATLDVLADMGYDRLTMDAVAHRAKACKATLYRRWNSKQASSSTPSAPRSPRARSPTPAPCATT